MKTTNAKMNRVQALEIAIESVENQEAKTVLMAIQASIEKSNVRKSTNGNPKKVAEMETLISELLQQLNKEKYLGYSDLDIDFQAVSNQKFTAMMKKAMESGLVEKGQTVNKKVGYKLV